MMDGPKDITVPEDLEKLSRIKLSINHREYSIMGVRDKNNRI